MKAIFNTEEKLGFHHQGHAEKPAHFDDLARYGAVPVGGIKTHSFNPHAEHSDPYCGTPYAPGVLMQAAGAGLSSVKLGKRKSRANLKPPIKVFSADTSNFMALVHRLTGFHSSAYLLAASPQTSLLKPLTMGSFTQGVYVPESPAGDKMTDNFSNNTYSSALSHNGRQQLDSVNDVVLSTKEGLSRVNSPSRAERFAPYSNSTLEAAHAQVLRDSNGWDSFGAVLLPNQGHPMKEDCRKEENFLSLFKEQRTLCEDVGATRH